MSHFFFVLTMRLNYSTCNWYVFSLLFLDFPIGNLYNAYSKCYNGQQEVIGL